MVDYPIYWNPVIETLPREKLRALQLKKFKRIFAWTYDHSRFHRALYDQAGVRPEDIRTFEDIRAVPKVEKSMMRDIQRKDPFPYGDALCVPLEEVTEFRQTSGTTGQPVYQPDTWQDWEWWAECWSCILWSQGYRPSDRVFLPFGYNIFVAFWAGHYAAEKIGCEVVPGGILDTKARILKIQELRATAMMATPTYVLGMADTARKMGIDPAALTIRRITCAGEPGAGIPSTKSACRMPGAPRSSIMPARRKSGPGPSSARSSPSGCTSMKACSWSRSKTSTRGRSSKNPAGGARWSSPPSTARPSLASVSIPKM
uniref:Coenzyme A-ligase n=1 Tax=Desulfobacterium sp. AK1 TaxID=416261 RepID=A3R4M3_9BACT|nr:coenzyme A-ligase [Desulfobacterium sp. AK1]